MGFFTHSVRMCCYLHYDLSSCFYGLRRKVNECPSEGRRVAIYIYDIPCYVLLECLEKRGRSRHHVVKRRIGREFLERQVIYRNVVLSQRSLIKFDIEPISFDSIFIFMLK